MLLRDLVLDHMRADPHREWTPTSLSPEVGASEGMVLRTLNYLIEADLVGTSEYASGHVYWPKSHNPVIDYILRKTRPKAPEPRCESCGQTLPGDTKVSIPA